MATLDESFRDYAMSCLSKKVRHHDFSLNDSLALTQAVSALADGFDKRDSRGLINVMIEILIHDRLLQRLCNEQMKPRR
jgi:hypothetical protein